MKVEQEILRALEELPSTALEQVKDFIAFLKETKGVRRSSLPGKELAKRQGAAIKRWAGANLGSGFAGKDHDEILYGSRR